MSGSKEVKQWYVRRKREISLTEDLRDKVRSKNDFSHKYTFRPHGCWMEISFFLCP